VGHVVLLLRTLKLHVVRDATLLQGEGTLLAELARSSLTAPSPSLVRSTRVTTRAA